MLKRTSQHGSAPASEDILLERDGKPRNATLYGKSEAGRA